LPNTSPSQIPSTCWAKVSDQALLGGGQETLPNTRAFDLQIRCPALPKQLKSSNESFPVPILFPKPLCKRLAPDFEKALIFPLRYLTFSLLGSKIRIVYVSTCEEVASCKRN
jgi:hypothetical protein